MSVSYVGLIGGNINPIDLVKLIKKKYGGDNFAILFTSIDSFYQISFTENYTPELLAMRPWERNKKATRRLMSVHVDGSCKCDYEHVTTDDMTYISLGHWGDCREIVDSLVGTFGGYIKDELGPEDTKDEFVRFEVIQAARAEKVA
jgi:hypothetical protein